MEIPSPGFGTYEMDGQTCQGAVETALEVGYRHLDTAEGYENEPAVGAGLDAATVPREDVFVATKVSPDNLAYGDVIAHAEASRDRLGLETIDLLYVHWPIGAYDPDETLPALDELRERGLVRHVALSNFTPALLDEALDRLDTPLVAHQVECHPLLPQERLREHADEHDYTLVAYSPLAKGSLIEDPVLEAVADEHDTTPAQVSLAWLHAKGAVPIPKSETDGHIRANFAVGEVDLTSSDIERIDAIDRRERVVDFPEAPWNS